jgi:hypothetical protein
MEEEIGCIDNKIDEIIRTNKIHHFALELQYTTDKNRKIEIKEILNSLEGSSSKTSTNSARDKLNKIYETIDSNALKKKWHILKENQKKDRLNEFIKRTEYKYGEQLLKLFGTKKFDNKKITYDNKKGEIISVSFEFYDENLEIN